MFLNQTLTYPADHWSEIELRWVIAGWAHGHYAELLYLFEPQADELREYLGDEMANRILWLNTKTHLGDSELFWYPLFEFVFGRKPLMGPQASLDEILWDRIIPHGCAELLRAKAYLPSHAGPFLERVPNFRLKKACT